MEAGHAAGVADEPAQRHARDADGLGDLVLEDQGREEGAAEDDRHHRQEEGDPAPRGVVRGVRTLARALHVGRGDLLGPQRVGALGRRGLDLQRPQPQQRVRIAEGLRSPTVTVLSGSQPRDGLVVNGAQLEQAAPKAFSDDELSQVDMPPTYESATRVVRAVARPRGELRMRTNLRQVESIGKKVASRFERPSCARADVLRRGWPRRYTAGSG